MVSRKAHSEFLELELKKQTDDFITLIRQTALSLIEKEEVFTSQFLHFHDGEMIVRFKSSKAIPRNGQYLTVVLLTDEMRSFNSWGNLSWSELRSKYQCAFSETVCIWQLKSKEDGFFIVGFRGINIDFSEKLIPRCLLTFGPKEPPLKYLQNLLTVVQQTSIDSRAARFLDFETINYVFKPIVLNSKSNISDFLKKQLVISDEVIVQGPPGTGKTYLMAELAAGLLSQNYTVLVTALTNRALMELASKPALKSSLSESNIYKCSLTRDELIEVPDLQNAKDVVCIPGALCMATFYITSDLAVNLSEGRELFDYLIVDEASQALLAMFACAAKLAKKIIFIGDPFQLPPIVSLNSDLILRKNAKYLVEGFVSICNNLSLPSFQLTQTYRLTKRAAKYTSIFYQNSLQSCSKIDSLLNLDLGGSTVNKYLHKGGGPVLIKSVFPIGDDSPDFGLHLIRSFLKELIMLNHKDVEIAILSKTKKTVKSIQRVVAEFITKDSKILVDTVERVQGLTSDYTIFFIPNSKMNYSLNTALFNVATSRSKRHTIIICDQAILDYQISSSLVKQYITELNHEHSFVILPDVKKTLQLE